MTMIEQKNRVLFFYSLFGAAASLMPAAAHSGDRRPNIIVILADDQGWGDLGYTGNTFVRTPTLDRVAREGVVFNNFYVCPVSSPTRAEFLTGRYHVRSGVSSTSGGGERLNLDEKTIAEYFRDAGYSTALFGKWHNGTQYPYHPNARGFAHFYGFCSGHCGNYWNPMLEQNGEVATGTGFIIDDLTDKSLDWISTHKDNPFFLFLSYNTPHSPMQVPDSWWNSIKNRDGLQTAAPGDEEDSLFTKAALALTENIDWNVGRLLSQIESLNLEEETVILYFSDNGPNSYRWNGGMKGKKGSTDEGGVRSPLCIRWPGRIGQGISPPQLAGAIDLLPTLLDLADISYRPAKPLDGISLKAQLLDAEAPTSHRALYSYWNRRMSVRTPGYLLSDKGELYHTAVDRSQNDDIATTLPLVCRQMRDSAEWFREAVLSDFREEDSRPFIIGHPQELYSKLPARDALATGAIERSNRYPNSSYFTNWRNTDDKIVWNVAVEEGGLFEVLIYYTCDKRNIGSAIELTAEATGEKLHFRLTEINDEPMLGADLDRVPREESYEKGFHPFSVGTLRLSKGQTALSLQAKEVKGEEVMLFRMLVLKRITFYPPLNSVPEPL